MPVRDPREMLHAFQKELEKREREQKIRGWNQGEDRHDKQVEAIQRPERVLAIYGGNRTGKTAFGAMRTVLAVCGSELEPFIQDWADPDQEWWYEHYYDQKEKINAWCGTENWDLHRDITQPALQEWIPQPIWENCEKTTRKKGIFDYLVFPNGSKLTFKSYDSGRDAFQGAALDYCWLDEECNRGIWREIQQRVMDKLGTVVLTMTPLKGLTWAYSEVYLREDDDNEVWTTHFTWDDNPWLDEAEKRRLERDMSESDLAARKYGKFLTAGDTVLDTGALVERQQQLPDPQMYMRWSEAGKFVAAPTGKFEIYEPPKRGVFYILGADVAEGLPSGDNSVISVIRADNAEQVAEFGGKIDTTTFANQIDWVGRWYNNALVVPERNNNGHAVLERLDKELMYPSIYKHKDDDRLGWPMTVKTRPIVVGYMQDFSREAPEVINSSNLIAESLSFVRNTRGRPEAAGKGKEGGSKDDRLIAWGLALTVRDQYGAPLDIISPKPPKPEFSNPQDDPWIEGDGDKDVQREKYANWDPSSYANFPVKPKGR